MECFEQGTQGDWDFFTNFHQDLGIQYTGTRSSEDLEISFPPKHDVEKFSQELQPWCSRMEIRWVDDTDSVKANQERSGELYPIQNNAELTIHDKSGM